jgi:hypothetical protein
MVKLSSVELQNLCKIKGKLMLIPLITMICIGLAISEKQLEKCKMSDFYCLAIMWNNPEYIDSMTFFHSWKWFLNIVLLFKSAVKYRKSLFS